MGRKREWGRTRKDAFVAATGNLHDRFDLGIKRFDVVIGDRPGRTVGVDLGQAEIAGVEAWRLSPQAIGIAPEFRMRDPGFRLSSAAALFKVLQISVSADGQILIVGPHGSLLDHKHPAIRPATRAEKTSPQNCCLR